MRTFSSSVEIDVFSTTCPYPKDFSFFFSSPCHDAVRSLLRMNTFLSLIPIIRLLAENIVYFIAFIL